jgi:hypothetical protein
MWRQGAHMQPVLLVPTLTLTIPPARARALALALATGEHTWYKHGPLALPDAPPTLEAAVAAADQLEAAGDWSNGHQDTTDDAERRFWRPNGAIDERGAFTWSPWGGGDRRITIETGGRVTLTAGARVSPWALGGSTFLGAVAIAAAGGLANLPRGVVELRGALVGAA